ncbi:unnamed protein product [Pleuronectes platessa]|uniref:Protein FAM117B n=1 Tax=Pleuronectes platessa TaxID=8262 RepID=A0A9N7U037_PLEPL|nr:unnamed protein product [Pleuronectes platessa]
MEISQQRSLATVMCAGGPELRGRTCCCSSASGSFGQNRAPALSDPNPTPPPPPSLQHQWPQPTTPTCGPPPCPVASLLPPCPSSLLLILLSVSRHRVQLWPSQGALAGSHLTGPWPQDDSQDQHAPYMRDKATQTPRAWADERRRGSHKRSASCGSTDQLKEIAKLRQQLQRSKRSSRHRREKDRKSPFNGSHTIIQSQSPMPKTILIPIPIAKSSAPRFRNSMEGLNQEIERIIIRDTPEKEETIVPQDVPDGHRAPPPVPPQQRSSSTRSIDTQTPSGGGLSSNHSNCSSRPDSISPSYLTVLNDTSGGSPYEEKELGPYSPLPKYAASPRPNNSYMFKREPPEGCEKVKVFEESMPKLLQDIPTFLCPDRNKVNFIPNSGSAFCLVSILKPLHPAPELSFRPGVGLRSLSPALVPLSTQPCLLEEPESF